MLSCEKKPKKIDFGKQDGKGISWTVIYEDKKSMILFADEILDARAYDSRLGLNVSFEESELYDYLNTDFINTYFSADERAKLFFINSYDDTLVTLISLSNFKDMNIGDVTAIKDDYYNNEDYFAANKNIITKATATALYNDIEVFDNETYVEIMREPKVDARYDFANGYSPYWILDKDDNTGMVWTVTPTGYIEEREKDILYVGVRPVIRIKK